MNDAVKLSGLGESILEPTQNRSAYFSAHHSNRCSHNISELLSEGATSAQGEAQGANGRDGP